MSFSFGFSGEDVDDGAAESGNVAVAGGGQTNGGEQFEGLPAMEHSLDEVVGMHCLSLSIPHFSIARGLL